MHHTYTVGLLKYARIERHIGIRREVVVDEAVLLFEVEDGMSVVIIAQHYGQQSAETVNQAVCVGYEHARIPQKFTTIHEYFGKIALRFLRKRLHAEYTVTLGFAHLDVSIAWFRTRRLHSHGKHTFVFCHKTECTVHALLKLFVANDSEVAWRYNDIGFRIDVNDAVSSPRHTRSCATMDRLGKHSACVKLRQLLAHKVGILFISINKDVLRWQYARKTIVGLLQRRASRAEEIDKLLWTVFARTRPQTAALASGQYDTIVIFCFFHVIIFNLGILSCFIPKEII